MDSDQIGTESGTRSRRGAGDGLSYKFQRLRERLRASVVGGEFVGRLPGERALARRFHVNAKTLSKALTDLAAEGLLNRTIGRGTYVTQAADGSAAAPAQCRCLIICEAERAELPIVRAFRDANPTCGVVHDVTGIRPSLLKQYDAVIDLGVNTPERFLRDLVVRNLPVVAVNREPATFSINTVGVDVAMGAWAVARDLILAGHRHLAVIESTPRSAAGRAVQQAAARYGPDAKVMVYGEGQAVTAVHAGATAIVCDATPAAIEARAALESAGVRVPRDVSLAAVGWADQAHPCSGQFADCAALVQNVRELLRGGTNHRPVLLWLAPHWVDKGTTAPAQRTINGEAAA